MVRGEDILNNLRTIKNNQYLKDRTNYKDWLRLTPRSDVATRRSCILNFIQHGFLSSKFPALGYCDTTVVALPLVSQA